ncbi:DNA methyltransferase [Proteus mirabilis]|uniref:DNA cytosine methyltransferase n=1 Tax=Proteus mirabilis TaxID=584 RepID=UPI00073C2C01|nr:DNA cytosine methyltransferase [Proteus mirabilis]EMA1122565.1 DNA cytosine methyltransferase [Proteus mirabilis]KSW15261.1 DNA methyltransferase [Proteus mirabilis]MDM3692133.1 DNA cytosine methyltransferase [Proteus mirabilis]MDW8540755.1 DNA cytosine methyltransferase [Proteus mirabilis]
MTENLDDKCNLTYIDLFSGCGGLSLGLGQAGWKGIFAIEKDQMAFSTFKYNLIDSENSHFEWPQWLPKEGMTVEKLLENYTPQLLRLKGKVSLLAGGPPCQGFSLAGQRNSNDPRNKLSEEYIKVVNLVSPKYLLLENVKGFDSVFNNVSSLEKRKPYSMIVKEKLEHLGYKIFHDYICCADYGVPQKRTRFIMIGIKIEHLPSDKFNPFELLKKHRTSFLIHKNLPLEHISVKEAIDDLSINKNGTKYHSGNSITGFKKINYEPPKKGSKYIQLIRKNSQKEIPNSLRLARHKQATIEKFQLIQSICVPGISLNDAMRLKVGTKKQAITVLNEYLPSKTLTTLPDDLLHYSEPRILTVREMARIQSFPDDFKILGKYTTGGSRRKQECPRYTQIGNAVPPLLGEALGMLMKNIGEHNE